MVTRKKLTPAEQVHLVRRLSKSAVFSLASPYELRRLLLDADMMTADAGEWFFEEGAEKVVIVLHGEHRIESAGPIRVDLGDLGGAIFGLDTSVEEVRSVPKMKIQALSRVDFVEIGAKQVWELHRRSPPFRSAMRCFLGEPHEKRAGAVVRFSSEFPGTPLSLLIDLLAREISSSFPDRVLIVRAPTSEPPVPVRIAVDGHGKLHRVEAGREQLEGLRARYDYVLLDGIDHDDVQIEVKLVHAYPSHRRTPPAPPAPDAPRVLHTTLVQPAPVPCANELTVVNANPQDLGVQDACRVHLSLESVRQLGQYWGDHVPLSVVDPRLRKNLGVWARALTLRRTGIALAGGGVFSMPGVYVLQELHKRHVPIDVITGTSGGSLVGSYYGALGLPGLEQLVEAGDSGCLSAVVMASMLTTRCLESYLSCAFDGACIEHLPYAEFYPASSALATGEGVVATRGPLALGVRAASSTPPILPATITASQRLADGAYTNNVPVQALARFNTAVTLGVNTYPPSRFGLCPGVPQAVSQMAANLGLVNRMMTFVTAFNLLAAVSGEIECGYATVSYNASMGHGAPYLIAADFCLSSKMVKLAAQNEALNQSISDFENAYKALGGRCQPALTGAVDSEVGAA